MADKVQLKSHPHKSFSFSVCPALVQQQVSINSSVVLHHVDLALLTQPACDLQHLALRGYALVLILII